MNISGLLFCSVTLIASFFAIQVLFPLAAMTPEEAVAITTPKEAELFDDVSVPDFGDVSVFDMVLHFIDNPPEESDLKLPEVRFQGC
jgi:hypothetical protein